MAAVVAMTAAILSAVGSDVVLLVLALEVKILVVEGGVTLKGAMRVDTIGAGDGVGRRRLERKFSARRSSSKR